RARAAAAVDHAPHEARVILAGEIVFGEPALQSFDRGNVELGADFAFVGALPHDPRVAALAKHHRQRIDQDRFAGASFAGQHGESVVELELHAFDDHEITD